MKKQKMTIEKFHKIKPGEIFGKGLIENSPDGLFMINKDIGRMLRWVAVKGYAEDWALYVLWADDSDWKAVEHYGDKVWTKDYIRNVMDMDEEVLKRYRP